MLDLTFLNSVIPLLTIGGAGMWIWFLLRRNSGDTKDMIINRTQHDIIQKNTEKELESIQTNKPKVVAKVKDLNKHSEEKKVKIKKIVDDAAEKNKKISKMTTVSEVDEQADNNWDEL